MTTPDPLKTEVVGDLLLLLGNLEALGQELLLIVGVLETPGDVVSRGLVVVCFDVMERVLRDVPVVVEEN